MGRYIGNAQVVGKEHAQDWVHLTSANYRVNQEAPGAANKPTSIGFTNLFTDDFDEYRFIFTGVRMAEPTSGDAYSNFGVQFNAVGQVGYNENAGDNRASVSAQWHYRSPSSGGGQNQSDMGPYFVKLTTHIAAAEVWGRAGWKDQYSRWGDWNITALAGEFTILRPQDTSYNKHFYFRGQGGLDANGNQRNGWWTSGVVKVAAALSDIKFYWESNRPFYSYDVEVYGLGK